jgi:rubrerythrin
MKTISFFSKLSLFVLVLAATSCGNTSKKTTDTEEAQAATEEQMQHEGHAMQSELSDSMLKDGLEYTSKYVCPMHCKGSGSDSEGKCPVCGMTYVLNENYNEAVEHDDNHNH